MVFMLPITQKNNQNLIESVREIVSLFWDAPFIGHTANPAPYNHYSIFLRTDISPNIIGSGFFKLQFG